MVVGSDSTGSDSAGGASASPTESPVTTSADILSHLVQFVSEKQFLFFAPVSKSWKAAWGQRSAFTNYVTAETSMSQLRYGRACGLPREDVDWCTMSARVGNLEVLRWARRFGCPWDEETCTLAARGGHIALLLWARRAGCPWNEHVCEEAASRGDLEMLKAARQRGCPWTTNVCALAAGAGHFEVLQWCKARGCRWDQTTSTAAARSGDLDVVKWVKEEGCAFTTHACAVAAGEGHLHVLEWLRSNGCPWDGMTCAAAAAGGHLAALQWARTRGCEWGEQTCTFAAGGGHLAILQWCRLNGCSWNERTCASAAKAGHLDLLKWCRLNDCPWDWRTCAGAAEGGHLELLKFCVDGGCPWSVDASHAAVEDGHLDVIKPTTTLSHQLTIYPLKNGGRRCPSIAPGTGRRSRGQAGKTYELEISICDFDGSTITGSNDPINFFTCSGGPHCVMPETPSGSWIFSGGSKHTFHITADVEPTTLAITKEGPDGWCLSGISWNGGPHLLAKSTSIFVDLVDNGLSNCNTQGLLDFTDKNPAFQDNLFYPCLQKWRIFNLQGNPDFENEFLVEGCHGVHTPEVDVTFCSDTTCSEDVVSATYPDFNAGLTSLLVPPLDFFPVSMLFKAKEEWCASAMFFNGFVLAAHGDLFKVEPGQSKIIENLQIDGEGFGLEISTCVFGGSNIPRSLDPIKFFTCPGGPYCDMPETPSAEWTFDTVEKDDGWCVSEISWNGGPNLLANSTYLFVDKKNNEYRNCNTQGLLDYVDHANPYLDKNFVYPCLDEWRFLNLQGNPDFENEFQVQGCEGVGTPEVNVTFCSDTTCNADAVSALYHDFDAGKTTLTVPPLNFFPASMNFSTGAKEWCADFMEFNGFHLLEADDKFIVRNNQPVLIPNLQVHGMEG
eukprot:g5206.t1